MTRKYRKDLAGKQVYPNYRIDKNISWHNFNTYPLGLIYGFITFEWLRPSCKFMLWRLKPWKIWLPPKYAKNYYEEIYQGKD